MTAFVAAATTIFAVATGAFALITGRLTIDVGVGRRLRPLGPLAIHITAPRERVFALITVPYLSAHPPRALREKIHVLERGTDMVIAAHRTRIGKVTTTTVEWVSFERPHEVRFGLLRGPVPLVDERFVLHEADDGSTDLEYSGSLGTDLWAIGAWWGGVVARRWERAVAQSLGDIKRIAEAAVERGSARLTTGSQ